MAGPPEFSALITCYFEERSIEEFHAKLSAALESLHRPYEIIMVNDGSTDRTFDKLRALFERDPQIAVVMDLFKNSGQQEAITAAITKARGKAILLMDSDLQLEPSELPLLVEQYDAGYDVVSGFRKHRQDSLFRILPSKIANIIMRKASDSNFTDFGCTFKIYNADLIRGFQYGPTHIFSNVDLISRANRCKEVPITHYPRKYGKSGWTFGKLWRYNADNIMKLSERPFQWLAVGCVAAAFLLIVRIGMGFLVEWRVFSEVTNGLLLNALVIVLLILLAVLAYIGELTIRNFVAGQHKPRYVIRECHDRRPGAEQLKPRL